mgnify:CR=1 FL=1
MTHNTNTDLLLIGFDHAEDDYESILTEEVKEGDFTFFDEKDEEEFLDMDLDNWDLLDDDEEDVCWGEMSYNRFNKDKIVYGEG